MGQATHLPIRQRMVELRSKGMLLREISKELDVSYWTVRGILRRHSKFGDQGLIPDYNRCGSKGFTRSNKSIKRASCWLKRLHPDWGAPFIHMKLSQRYTQTKIPGIRQMQRWFRHKGLNEPLQRLNESKVQRAQRVHEYWQVDAKERFELANGKKCSYLSVVDEKSGGALGAVLFSIQPHQSGTSTKNLQSYG